MSYLYLNFADNMESGLGEKHRGKNEFFTQSLKDQYEVLKRTIGASAPDTLQQFIEYVCSQNIRKYYYISLPAFSRCPEMLKNGTKILRNIVVRPEKDNFALKVLPQNYDFILVGDIAFGKVIDITVKGLDFLDSSVIKYGEQKVLCTAACSFTTKRFPLNGSIVTVPDFGNVDLHDVALTNDFVNDIVTKSFPVKEPEEVMQKFDKWKEYIKFRNYYLAKQSEICTPVSDVTVCDAYMITKEIFKKNINNFSELLLDEVPEFGKGEQIILSKKVDGSDGFPLICVSIQKNRKEVLSELAGKNGKGKPKFEVWLNRYTREPMGLSPSLPKYDDKGNSKSVKSYLLGERYLFSHTDIEPDLTSLENRYKVELDAKFNDIDNKYDGIIRLAISRYAENIELGVKSKYEKTLLEYKNGLEEKLESDMLSNSDKEISNQYKKDLQKQLNELEMQRKQKCVQIRAEIYKNKALSRDDKEKQIYEKEQVLNEQYQARVTEAKSALSLRNYYIKRISALIEKKKKSLAIKCQEEIEILKTERIRQFKMQYESDIINEKNKVQDQLRQEFDTTKEKRIENETIRCYRIYFRPDDVAMNISEINKQIEAVAPKYLTYDNRAEKTKIDRQDRALNCILGGFVKNPFLPTYLFSPEALAQSVIPESNDPEWCLETLNDRQKLAVKRALQSESIFLLQGPPGTGKTQVIAEITAQLAKRGKKILISSETHKAIDNVFERLPKIPEIRPLRLIPSQNGKETNYSPEKLVDNLYLNISGNLEKQIARFENFEGTKTEFADTMRSLRIDYEKILKLKNENVKIERQRNSLLSEITRVNNEINDLREYALSIKEQIECYDKTFKYIESCRFEGEGIDKEIMTEFTNEVDTLLKTFSCFESLSLDKVGVLIKINPQVFDEELSHLLSSETMRKLNCKQKELKEILSSLRDPITDDAPNENDDNYFEYKKYQKELIDVAKKLEEVKKNTDFDFSSTNICAIVPNIVQSTELMKKFPEELKQFKLKLAEIVNLQRIEINKRIKEYTEKEYDINEKLDRKKLEISEMKYEYEDLGKNNGFAEYSELNTKLKQRISRFFRDFSIVKEYDSENFETAFEIIREEWNKIESEYNASSETNKVKIPLYKDIVNYLSQLDILEEDRLAYTRDLYNSANVFGITCTSRDKFTANQLAELGKYGIDSVDIRTQGIDVVIVDEVSKSSFLDLLIPILYGKTVILVGDHRQLPPMYDLRHLRSDDFDGLDEGIITKRINDEFTNMYEECFFKTLYEKVPNDFRIMLNKQYRCHSHIMEVFNHFYGGNGLILGKKQQDAEKEHGITVKINGNTIIEPLNHVYFVDCDQNESSAFEGSTSKINEQEAQVAITLLKEIDKSAKELVSGHRIIVDPSRKIDERPSVGIICTYGDQAGLIKKKRKNYRFEGFSEKQDEKLVISTVDDFQGDERDIVIVSMVRNPAGKHYDAEFIKKFERINVALSRARKLLIIVGSKKFLSDAGIIDLPDIEGNKILDKINFPVYREIIDTINFRGRILTANDILGE